MIIYIYGNNKFKREIKNLLSVSSVDSSIEDISSLDILKNTIKEHPHDIFLIDHSKIIDSSKLINKLNFLKPKDGIEKNFLDQYGVGDICFNSMDGFIRYIHSRIEHQPISISEDDIVEEETFEFNNSIDTEIESDDELKLPEEEIALEDEDRDLANIIYIDDIFDSEMEDAMGDFKNDKTKSKD